jgi:hypothetical protein
MLVVMAATLQVLRLAVVLGVTLCLNGAIVSPLPERALPQQGRARAPAADCPASGSGSVAPVNGYPLGWTGRWIAAAQPVIDSQGDSWVPDGSIARGGTMEAASAAAGPPLSRYERLGVSSYAIAVPTPGRWAVVVTLPTSSVATFDLRAGDGATAQVDGDAHRTRHAVLVTNTSTRSITVTVTPRTGVPAVSAVSVGLVGPSGPALTRYCDDFNGRRGMLPAELYGGAGERVARWERPSSRRRPERADQAGRRQHQSVHLGSFEQRVPRHIRQNRRSDPCAAWQRRGCRVVDARL